MRCVVCIILLIGLPASAAGAQPASEEQVVAHIQEAAATELATRFPDRMPHLEVRVLRTSDGIPATADVQIAFPAGSAVPHAHTQVDVLGANAQKVGWALLYVAHFDSVVVSRSRLTKDTEIDPSQLSIAWMETTTFHGEPLRAHTLRALQHKPLFASRYIREGQALRMGDLRPAFAADTGDQVLMDYTRGTIALRLSCQAREPGAVGDEIRLYAPNTETTYRARLVAPGHAEWLETLQ